MSLRFIAYVTLAMTVTVSSALAQEEGGRRQRGGQGGGQGGAQRGGMMGMGRGGGGASAIIGLLRMEEVRKEVEVSEDVYKSASESLQEDQRKLFQRDTSEEDRKKISAELDSKAMGIMEEIMTPENQKRLMGLYAQYPPTMGRPPAVLNTVIAKEIGLSEGDRAKLEKELLEETTKSAEKMREQFAGGGGERPDFTKIQEAVAKMQEETNKFVEGKLTADQKKALETLKGEKFKFPEQQRGGFGGGAGGGRGGAEGGGARGGRGGDGGGRPRGDGN